MNKEPSIYINPCVRAVPSDLISSSGTVFITFDEINFKLDSTLFCFETDEYFLYADTSNQIIKFQRNNYKIEMPVNTVFKNHAWISLFFEWSPIFIRLSYYFIPLVNENAEYEIKTPYTIAPPSLIRFLRKQNLIETKIYNSEVYFRDKIYSILGTLQNTIDSFLSENIFWDIAYDGNKIISKTPKKETDLHSILQGILLDQFLMSSIEVIPEYSMGVGRLDFMFQGNIKELGMVKFCLEVKLGHSVDIYSGLTKQLPMYMENSESYNGIYLVLWFGKSLKPSDFNDLDSLNLQLLNRVLELSPEFGKRIRIFSLDLTQSTKASTDS